jgi:hypothetical protein
MKGIQFTLLKIHLAFGVVGSGQAMVDYHFNSFHRLGALWPPLKHR